MLTLTPGLAWEAGPAAEPGPFWAGQPQVPEPRGSSLPTASPTTLCGPCLPSTPGLFPPPAAGGSETEEAASRNPGIGGFSGLTAVRSSLPQ